MRFKPIPDSTRCAAIDSKHIVIARIEGTWSAFATDSDYVLEKILEPFLEDAEELRIFTNEGTRDDP